jgi:rRNA maturation endonuclease Nob1
MKFVFEAAGKTGDISTTDIKAMKLSFSTREWDHSISNTFVNPTVNIHVNVSMQT